jgi:hypothetical protein
MYTEEELKSLVNSEFKKSVAEYQEKGMALKLIDKTTGEEVDFKIIKENNFDSSQYDLNVICGSQSNNLEVIAVHEKYYIEFIQKMCSFLGPKGEAFPRVHDSNSKIYYSFFYSPKVEKGKILLEEISTSTKIIARSFCEGDLVKIPSAIDTMGITAAFTLMDIPYENNLGWAWLSRIKFFEITNEERSRIFDIARNLDKLK